MCTHFFGRKKIKLGSAKRRGWNQIRGLLVVTPHLIASPKRMSTGTCPDRLGQLVKTHEPSATQKVTLPSSSFSFNVVLLDVCYFYCENMQRQKGKKHVGPITVPPIYVAFGEKTRFSCHWSCLNLHLMCLLQSRCARWGTRFPQWTGTFISMSRLLQFGFIAMSSVLTKRRFQWCCCSVENSFFFFFQSGILSKWRQQFSHFETINVEENERITKKLGLF